MQRKYCAAVYQETSVNVENEDGTQEFIEADTVVYALGMKANSTSELHSAAG